MSSEASVVIGSYQIQATEDIAIESQGSGVYIRSAAGNGLHLDSATQASLVCGPAVLALTNDGPQEGKLSLGCGPGGTILLNTGPPNLGPVIVLEPDAIRLSVGPPGVGASLVLTATGITLKVADTSYALTPLSIKESIAETSRQATVTGHQLTAAETAVKVSVAGLIVDAPMKKESYEASAVVSASLAQTSIQGMSTEKAGIRMVQ